MNLVDEITRIAEQDRIDFDALEEALEKASHPERVEATRKWWGKTQQRIYEQAQGRVVTLEQLVPPSVAPMEPVHHWGKNTLAPGIDHFQKRFVRPEDRDDVLWGYNENWYRWAASPGFYVAYEDDDNDEVVIDYTRYPERVPPQWPEIGPNWRGVGFFAYHGMVDRLRTISDHVTIGRAYIRGKYKSGAFFTLVRED